ncbi:hypothetical protein N8198_10890, partial [Gammaproteobacteria bacterium]|nr:hypothetical protein [Gammaproteobacteria bacterium]
RETEREIEQGRQALAEASEQHNLVQGQFYRLGSDISGKEQAIEHQKNLRQRSREELTGLQQSLQEAQKMLGDDGARLQQLEQELGDITPQLDTGNQHLRLQQERLDLAEIKMQEWQELWDQFRREFHQVHEAAQIENRGIEHIERQVQRTEQQRQRLQQELENLDTSQAVREIDVLEASVEGKADEYAATMAQAQTRADQIQALRISCEERANQLDEKRGQVQTLRGRLSSLEALQQHALSETSDTVKQWLAANNIDSSRRLTSLLKVKGDIDKAVEIVMAPFLGAYSVAVGQSIPDTIVPKHGVALFERDPVPAGGTYRDWPQLVDFIDCDIDLSSLLDGIYLCRDAADLRAKRPQLHASESLVTPQGLWAGRNWVLQLSAEDEHAGSLARAQEIEKIRAELEAITALAMDMKSHYDGDRQRLVMLEQEWDSDQKNLTQLQQQLSEFRQQLSNRQSQAEQVQQRREQLQVELAELEEQKVGHASELQSNSNKRNEFLEQIASMTTLEEGLLAQKSERQQQLVETREELQRVRDTAHQQQIRLQALQAEQRAAQSNMDRVRQQSEQFEQRILELDTIVNGAEDPIAGLELELQELLQQRILNEQELNLSQQKVGEFDSRQRELEHERNNRQQQLDEFRNEVEQERLQLQEARVRCTTIEEQLQKTGQDVVELAQNLDAEAELTVWSQRLEAL